MPSYITSNWMWFCIAFGMVLVKSFMMRIQSMNFYTQDVVIRRFSIMDLVFPASPLEVVLLIKGIYGLPVKRRKKTLQSLKAQLYIDFLFMPAVYGTIFLACMKVSLVMKSFSGQELFADLAWIQILPFICDILENIYLLNKISPNIAPSKQAVHKAFHLLEIIKWGIALTGAICAIAAIVYLWLTGRYSLHSLNYLLILAIEIILFFVAGKIASGKLKKAE